MSAYRFYKCGCCPDLEEFCEKADKRVWAERDAATALVLDGISKEEQEKLDHAGVIARAWLYAHYTTLEQVGAFQDVAERHMEPPDDFGGDEPQEVVNP